MNKWVMIIGWIKDTSVAKSISINPLLKKALSGKCAKLRKQLNNSESFKFLNLINIKLAHIIWKWIPFELWFGDFID